jgi:hypothetical protein
MITLDQFEQAMQSLDGYFGVAGLMGGQPNLHRDFEAICEIMAAYIEPSRRGLWTQDLAGTGAICRKYLNPAVSNFNLHCGTAAAEEFRRDWPEAVPYLKGINEDSDHAPLWVSMKDIGVPEEERWERISRCDVNAHWSAMILPIHGEIRGFFCEIAAHMCVMHSNDPNWPQWLGVPIVPSWWRLDMNDFGDQVDQCCHNCGIPMRGSPQLALGGTKEQVSPTHAPFFKTKDRNRTVEIVTLQSQLGHRTDRTTHYLDKEPGKVAT